MSDPQKNPVPDATTPAWAVQLNEGAAALNQAAAQTVPPTVPAPIQSPVPQATPGRRRWSPVPTVAIGPTGNVVAAPQSAETQPKKPQKPQCITEGCKCVQQSRGLCTKCGKAAARWVKEDPTGQKLGWDWLVKEGHALPTVRDNSENKFMAKVNASLEKLQQDAPGK